MTIESEARMNTETHIKSIRQQGKEDLLRGVSSLAAPGQAPTPTRAGTWRSTLFACAVIGLLAAAAGWYGGSGIRAAYGPAAKDSAPRSMVVTQPPATGNLITPEHGIKISGFFTAHDTVQISATVLARVKRILVHEGMTVHKGDLMVELSNANGNHDLQAQQQSLQGVQHQVSKVLLGLQNAELELQRQNMLMEKGFGTRKALQDAKLSVDQAKMELAASKSTEQAARASLEALRENRLEYTIRAPFSGVVIAQNARVGEVVSPSNGGSYIRSGLLSLVDPATLEVEISVQERLLPQIRGAGCALVTSLAEGNDIRDVPFRLRRINSVADRQRGAVNAILVPVHDLQRLPILETSAEVRFVPMHDPACRKSQDSLNDKGNDVGNN
jgi:HlyD family secretion protein